MLESKIPSGPIEQKWEKSRFDMKLVNPANRRKHTIIIVGSGLAGAAAAASLGQQGYHVDCFSFHDSPRRAHSIAAQGGINAAKNYRNDGDSIFRLFYDTVKGGDFRSREANVYRLAQISVNIIDQCVAQGVPFASEYGGLLDTRSFGGVQVSRTFYARGQTGPAIVAGRLPGARGANRRRHREDAHAQRDAGPGGGERQGARHRHAQSGDRRDRMPRRRCGGAGDGRLRQRFLPFDQRQGLQHHGHLAGSPARRVVRQSLLHANSSDLHSREQRKSVQAHADVRIAAQRRPRLGSQEKGRHARPGLKFPRTSATTTWSAATRASAIWCRATWPRAMPRKFATKGAASAPEAWAFTWILPTPFAALGEAVVREKYGNLFDMYEEITGENAYKVPMRIFPAVHYTMGGLWVDYQLMSTIPGLFVAGEANFSDHGANRLGASALMQGLADGYFILPYTLPNYIASSSLEKVDTSHPAFAAVKEEVNQRIAKLVNIRGKRTVDSIHKELGKMMWDNCGMARSAEGLREQSGQDSRHCARNSGTTSTSSEPARN